MTTTVYLHTHTDRRITWLILLEDKLVFLINSGIACIYFEALAKRGILQGIQQNQTGGAPDIPCPSIAEKKSTVLANC